MVAKKASISKKHLMPLLLELGTLVSSRKPAEIVELKNNRNFWSMIQNIDSYNAAREIVSPNPTNQSKRPEAKQTSIQKVNPQINSIDSLSQSANDNYSQTSLSITTTTQESKEVFQITNESVSTQTQEKKSIRPAAAPNVVSSAGRISDAVRDNSLKMFAERRLFLRKKKYKKQGRKQSRNQKYAEKASHTMSNPSPNRSKTITTSDDKKSSSKPVMVLNKKSKADSDKKQQKPPRRKLNIISDANVTTHMDVLFRDDIFKDKVMEAVIRKAVDDVFRGSKETRRSALRTIVALGAPAEPFLISMIDSNDNDVIAAAVEGLSQIDSRNLITCLEKIMSRQDPTQRIIALRIAQRLCPGVARPLLEKGLYDESPKVRLRTLNYLSWKQNPWSLAHIRRLCHDQDPEVKWAAIEALANNEPVEAWERLKLLLPTMDAAMRRRTVTIIEKRTRIAVEASNPTSAADRQEP